ncbi:hypothetical protein VR41_05325 [Streptomyces sp. NRRL B-1568]|nr:hypothetical protein VR41_05325 [Streptomyces sp. NRRL B-1568]
MAARRFASGGQMPTVDFHRQTGTVVHGLDPHHDGPGGIAVPYDVGKGLLDGAVGSSTAAGQRTLSSGTTATWTSRPLRPASADDIMHLADQGGPFSRRHRITTRLRSQDRATSTSCSAICRRQLISRPSTTGPGPTRAQ